MSHHDKSARAIEREVEDTRSQVSATLDELRNKMAPRAVVDSVVVYAMENGGADFLRTFGKQVQANPLPVTLIGAGIAWLAVSNNRSTNRGERNMSDYRPATPAYPKGIDPLQSSGSSVPGLGERAGASAAKGASTVSETASGMASSVRSTVAAVGETVSSAYDNVAEAVADGAGAVSGAVRGGYQSVQHGYESASSLTTILKEQPLITLALGIAVGAAIGAALPGTRTENEYLGAASDLARDRVQEMASQQYANVQETAKDAFDAVKSEAQAQGLTSDAPTEMLRGLGDKLGAVAGAAKTAVSEGVERSSKTVTTAIEETVGSTRSKA